MKSKAATSGYRLPPWRRRRSLAEAGALVLALLGLLGGPCVMAFATGAEVDSPVEVLPVGHDNCPNEESDGRADDDCCCLLKIAGGAGGSTPKPTAPAVMSALVVAPEFVLPDVQHTVVLNPRSSLHQTSPPVYLATQRLRI